MEANVKTFHLVTITLRLLLGMVGQSYTPLTLLLLRIFVRYTIELRLSLCTRCLVILEKRITRTEEQEVNLVVLLLQLYSSTPATEMSNKRNRNWETREWSLVFSLQTSVFSLCVYSRAPAPALPLMFLCVG